MSGDALLEASGVSKHFGGVRALHDVSVTLGTGEVVALVGDNGAGKSTFVKTIAGIQRPDSGTFIWKGSTATIDSPQDATDLGIQTVYQDLALCDNLDTVQNLFLGRDLRGPWWAGRRLAQPRMESRTSRLLRDLGVKIPSMRTKVGSLSGGQRQSIAVARSVLWDPQMVILDEPTAALGVEQREQVLDLILRLRQQGRSVLVISHDMKDVQAVADRVVVLRLGRKVAEHRRGEFTHEELVRDITGAAEIAPQGGSGDG